jgi:hypothetical protein
MATHRYAIRVSCICFILVGLIGTYFVPEVLVNLFHKMESLPALFVNRQSRMMRTPLRSANIIYYPGSRSFNECVLVYGTKTNKCHLDPPSYYFSKYDYVQKRDTYMIDEDKYQNVMSLPYSESNFRNALYPILWLDSVGDVHWNEEAERKMYQLLLDKQFPKLSNSHGYVYEANDYINDCESRHLILLEQWLLGGFLSRVNCLIEQFGQSLYSPSMAVLLPKHFHMGSAMMEDFMHEGILGYYAPMSQCSAYIPRNRLKNISESVSMATEGGNNNKSNYIKIQTFEQLRQVRPSKKYLWLQEQWKFGYEHVPHRRWLFDRMSYKSKAIVHYNSSIDVLTDHTLEHIYHAPNLSFDLDKWHPRNAPVYASTIHLKSNYTITWKDKVFTAFLRYMFTLFFHQFAPRIEISKNLLVRYWSSYLADSKHQSYHQALSSMAVVYARRGDHTREDPFYQRFGHWRNISLFLRTLYDEEKRLNKTFSPIFFLSDDARFASSALEFASKNTSGPDENFARQYLFGRDVIYNIYAPDACRKPFSQFDFDQYLVTVQFIIRHSAIIVTQILSNLGTYLEAIIYAENQLLSTHQTSTRIKYVRDIF